MVLLNVNQLISNNIYMGNTKKRTVNRISNGSGITTKSKKKKEKYTSLKEI